MKKWLAKTFKLHAIREYKDVYSAEDCKKIIDFFTKKHADNETEEGSVSSKYSEFHEGGDFLSSIDYNMKDYDHDMNVFIHSKLVPVLKSYLADYKHIIVPETTLYTDNCILSLYKAGEGFFAPHQDAIAYQYLRSLTIICYFNDVKSGGDTYFFNQDINIKPEAGKVLVFPSGFEYGHEGKKPVSNDKYIAVTFASVDVGRYEDWQKAKQNGTI